MKRAFILIIFILLNLFFCCSAKENNNYEIDLDKYLNDFNIQEVNTKKLEKFEKKSSKDFQVKDKNEYKNGDFSFIMDSKSVKDSKYLYDGFDQKSSLNYNKNGFGLSAGAHGQYTVENASGATREIFFTPKYNYKDKLSVELNNYMDTKGDYFTQELGFKYRPKMLKNGSVGVSGGTKFNKDSTRSEKLKFSTEFYLF